MQTTNRQLDRARIFLRGARGGFTIMELMVVLLIMGIVAAITAPSFYASLQYHEIETAARRLALDLQQARHAARVKSQTQSLTFNNSTTYTLSTGIASLRGGSQTYVVNLAQPPYDLDGIALHLGGATAISFDGFGNASVGGTIDLMLGDETRVVTINSTTGQITFSEP